MRIFTTIVAILFVTTAVMATGPDGKDNGNKKTGAKVVNVKEVLKAKPYPQELRDLGIEGKVLVSFWIDPSGKVSKYRVEEASHTAFEEYVLEHIEKFRFSPAKDEMGKAIFTRVKVPFLFELSI